MSEILEKGIQSFVNTHPNMQVSGILDLARVAVHGVPQGDKLEWMVNRAAYACGLSLDEWEIRRHSEKIEGCDESIESVCVHFPSRSGRESKIGISLVVPALLRLDHPEMVADYERNYKDETGKGLLCLREWEEHVAAEKILNPPSSRPTSEIVSLFDMAKGKFENVLECQQVPELRAIMRAGLEALPAGFDLQEAVRQAAEACGHKPAEWRIKELCREIDGEGTPVIKTAYVEFPASPVSSWSNPSIPVVECVVGELNYDQDHEIFFTWQTDVASGLLELLEWEQEVYYRSIVGSALNTVQSEAESDAVTQGSDGKSENVAPETRRDKKIEAAGNRIIDRDNGQSGGTNQARVGRGKTRRNHSTTTVPFVAKVISKLENENAGLGVRSNVTMDEVKSQIKLDLDREENRSKFGIKEDADLGGYADRWWEHWRDLQISRIMVYEFDEDETANTTARITALRTLHTERADGEFLAIARNLESGRH